MSCCLCTFTFIVLYLIYSSLINFAACVVSKSRAGGKRTWSMSFDNLTEAAHAAIGYILYGHRYYNYSIYGMVTVNGGS